MSTAGDKLVPLGRIAAVHGVRGWLSLYSFTEPRSNLLDYRSWWLTIDGRTQRVEIEQARESGRRLLAKVAGIDDRDAAAALCGAEIGVPRSALPRPDPGEYYWTDLEGLDVVAADGGRLGRVTRLVATGAHDVLVLDGSDKRMIPFAVGRTVRRVDLDRGEIIVDWDETFWE